MWIFFGLVLAALFNAGFSMSANENEMKNGKHILLGFFNSIKNKQF